MAGMMGVNMAMGQCATRSTSYQTVLSWLPGEINTDGRAKDNKIFFCYQTLIVISTLASKPINIRWIRISSQPY